jgi:hypothetical protein
VDVWWFLVSNLQGTSKLKYRDLFLRRDIAKKKKRASKKQIKMNNSDHSDESVAVATLLHGPTACGDIDVSAGNRIDFLRSGERFKSIP